MSEIDSDQVFIKLKQRPQNNQCFECKTNESSWCSVNHGIFLCLKCAGLHRGLGVHLSFVRSLTMDSFTPKQLAMMSVGGNQALSEFFSQYSLDEFLLEEKYRTVAAFYYRQKLSFASEGVFIDKPRPSFEDGRILIEEERKVFKAQQVDQQKSAFSSILEKTMETTKDLKEKVSEISMKDVENKVREGISKVEKLNLKDRINHVKGSAGSLYRQITKSAKKAFKPSQKEIWYEGKLLPGEDELLLNPEHLKSNLHN